jgi:predicted ester cyclase
MDSVTSVEQRNEQTVRDLFEYVINGREYERIPQYCAPDIVMHRPGNRVTTGHDAYETHYRRLHSAFPDFEATLTDIVVDAERLATRFSVSGTHEGELFGIHPTGKHVEFSAQVLFRFTRGTVTEEFHQSDRLGLRNQITSEP